MAYREARRPAEIAEERFRDCLAVETGAVVAKHDAQAALAIAQHELEAAWREQGHLTELERHIQAVLKAAEVNRRPLEPDALAAISEKLRQTEQDSARARERITTFEAAIAAARVALERRTDELAVAVKNRIEAEAELRRHSGR